MSVESVLFVMPSDEEERTKAEHVSRDWLYRELRSNPGRLIILDCRSSNEFGESHIRQAVNFSIPSIMLRRLAAGKIDLASTVRSRELKERIVNALKENVFVLYGDSSPPEKGNDTICILSKRLAQDGCRVVCLEDSFAQFRASYPEWCETVDDSLSASDPDLPLMGLRSLRISAYNVGGRCAKCDECNCSPPCLPGKSGHEEDSLVEILPFLFLGNAANSADLELLVKHGIKYILNVTPDLPNVFEGKGEIQYMKIPIADHWSQNLAAHFPKAIEFIDEARSKEAGVLVHCVAGVSRSVTVTLGYLMSRLGLSLNDAFALVRTRKANVAPNFHFMEQLHTFEQELAGGKSSSSSIQPAVGTFLSPAGIGQSPDSGIEFDRWTPGTGE